MSKIHYFQRYSSIENTVTNNTLQLIARIYDYSASAASSLLSELTGEDIDIGIEISQQEPAGNSVPDGAIIQRSFKILIEAKVDSPVDRDQLLRHAQTFGGESQKLLLLLTKQSIGNAEQKIATDIRAAYSDVIFKNITYEAICNAVKGLFKEHEASMVALVADYTLYCTDVHLSDQSKFLLRIVPCGQSVKINRKHGIYFHPSDRGYTQHAFIGIYANKTVQSILEVESVFDINFTKGELEKTLVQGKETNKFDTHLIDIIKDAKELCGYEIATGHRFFCGEAADTDFRKASPGGIQGARFINLRDLLDNVAGAKDVASRLHSLEWK
jgi:hypothetical protein